MPLPRTTIASIITSTILDNNRSTSKDLVQVQLVHRGSWFVTDSLPCGHIHTSGPALHALLSFLLGVYLFLVPPSPLPRPSGFNSAVPPILFGPFACTGLVKGTNIYASF